MDGDAALAAFIDRVRGLRTLGADAAKLAAPYVLEAARETAAAGTTPSGEAWAPKKSGGRALVNAADALSVENVGSVVVLKLTGPEVVHNYGNKRVPQRRILPAGGAGIPPNIAKALERAAKEAFDRTMGGGT
jgi:hypothetical protein